MNVGGSYAWDSEFATVGRRFVFQPGEGIIRAPDADSSWCFYASAWQYLFADTPEGDAAPLNLVNGAPDLKGLGVFARIGFGDDETNPIDIAASAGLGTKGLIPGRDADVMGIGWFYTSLQTGRLLTAAGVEDSSHGFEAFYNIAITPAVGLTLDAQVVEAPASALDTAVVLGMRLLMRF